MMDFLPWKKISFCFFCVDILVEEVKHFLVSLTSSPCPSVCCHWPTFPITYFRRKLGENHKESIFPFELNVVDDDIIQEPKCHNFCPPECKANFFESQKVQNILLDCYFINHPCCKMKD